MEPSEVTSECDPLLPNQPCVASMATPPRSLGKNKSGHILNSDSRNMIFHCYTYWRNREPEHSMEDTSKFVADMLCVSITTEFSERMERPSLRRCSVSGLLAEIGFKHEKRSRTSLLIDRDDITNWRNRYFRDVERYRAKRGRLPVRLSKWPDDGSKTTFGKGERLIVTHIGSEDGFVDGCLDVFRGQKTGDYHEETDVNRFKGWFGDVLPKSPAGSVFVLDNAPYHSRREEKLPKTARKREEIHEWLTSKDIIYGERMIKNP
ncbi:hypothetical protein HPB50_011475 [Hyalomma asiaticum]|uniref:Uncharacterized protein n=1 Tax=Hyalomma asiaticum TaxID=266040 RepID=A0ACB7SMS8_HYAAI|nr:hypothetical protein HPB50_011475 [Hyalomma asiaticum]